MAVFYRHFSSKEGLAAAAFRHAVDGIVADMENAETAEARRDASAAYLGSYLSKEHVANTGEGCPLAAIATEAGRQGGALRQAASDAARRTATLLDNPNGLRTEEPTQRGMAVMALLLGSVTLARLAANHRDAEKTLAAARKALDTLLEGWPTEDAK